MPGPLAGLRVLDLTWVLSGPFATMVLGDLGAEVIKVEQPGKGDSARSTGPFIDGLSSYFSSINRGKRSVTIDLKHPAGKELLIVLAKKSDVVVENFVPGTMDRLGLDYSVLAGHNPRLIYAACSGFGQTGPDASKPALDMVIQAMAGTLSITGEPGGPPARVGFSVGDLGAALFLAVGILAALQERERSGRGQLVEVSMLDAQIALLENAFARYFATGEVPGPLGTRHPVVTPFQAFPSADGYVVVAVSSEEQWQRFCRHVGREDWLADRRFGDKNARTANHAALEPQIKEIMATKPTAQWLAELEPLGIPCGPVNDIAQAAELPQVRAREMIVALEHPRVGRVRLTNSPLKYSRTPAKVERPAPDLGEHTASVLQEILGLSAAEVARLCDERVI